MTPTQIVFAEILGMTHDEYAEYIYQRGIQWLHAFHGDDHLSIELFEHSSYFWNDWKDMFAERDNDLFDLFSADQLVKVMERKRQADVVVEFHRLWQGAHCDHAIRECPNRSTLKLMNDEARERAVAEYNMRRAKSAV